MATVVGIDTQNVKRTSCRKCASIIEYTESETRQVTSRDISGVSDTSHILTCPKCGHDITTRVS